MTIGLQNTFLKNDTTKKRSREIHNYNCRIQHRSPLNQQKQQREISKNIDLNITLSQIDLTDIYRTFHSIIAKYTLFSSAQGRFKTENFLGHKANFIILKLYKLQQKLVKESYLEILIYSKIKQKTSKQLMN